MNKDFKVKAIFNLVGGKQPVEKDRFTNPSDGLVPAITGVTVNNGVGFYTTKEGKKTYKDILTISKDGEYAGTVYLQDREVYLAGHSMGLIPKMDIDNKCLIYIASLFVNYLRLGYWKINAQIPSVTDEKMDKVLISLPVIESSDADHEYTVDDIDWQYMLDRITELERDCITELDAYLQATGLNDYELTEEDKKILSLSPKRASDENGTLEDNSEDGVRFGEFALGGDDGLFNIYSPKKRFNANAITFGGKYPYVTRGSSNNGIRGYITEDERYLSPAKSLSFGQDTSTVYYQPDAYFTGDKIKVMVLNDRELTPELAEYFIATIARAFSTFAWGQSSFDENIIKSMKIELPIKSDGTPDFDYMERYIRAIEKVVIADVVKYKNKVIETTKIVVGE